MKILNAASIPSYPFLPRPVTSWRPTSGRCDHFESTGHADKPWTRLQLAQRINFPRHPDATYAASGRSIRLSPEEASTAICAASCTYLPAIQHPVAVRRQAGVAVFDGKWLDGAMRMGPVNLDGQPIAPAEICAVQMPFSFPSYEEISKKVHMSLQEAQSTGSESGFYFVSHLKHPVVALSLNDEGQYVKSYYDFDDLMRTWEVDGRDRKTNNLLRLEHIKRVIISQQA